jgi:hypothetical protein
MARTPVGTIKQSLSTTALLVYIASRLENVPKADLDSYAEKLGIQVGANAIRNAPRTSALLDSAPNRSAVVQPWALLNYEALDLFVAIAKIGTYGNAHETARAIASIPGVIESWGFADGGPVLVEVAYERRSDQTALRSRLGEFGRIDEWREVDDRHPEAAATTFRTLARRAAERERLRVE